MYEQLILAKEHKIPFYLEKLLFQFVILANKIHKADLLYAACLYKKNIDLNLCNSNFVVLMQ